MVISIPGTVTGVAILQGGVMVTELCPFGLVTGGKDGAIDIRDTDHFNIITSMPGKDTTHSSQ